MIKSRVLVSVIVLLLNAFNLSSGCSEEYDFDYMLLALQWPESFCETTKCVAHQDVWSIHGSWPQNYSGKWPSSCCFEKKFNPQTLSPIRDELTKVWATLRTDWTGEDFWEHEWTKHGTCCMKVPELKGELNYFKNTLQAFSELSVDKWLSDADITPSETKMYPLTDFLSAVSTGLGHKVHAQCLTKKHNSSPIMAQINVCLNKNTLLPFDCPTNMKDEHCGDDTIAYLPSKK